MSSSKIQLLRDQREAEQRIIEAIGCHGPANLTNAVTWLLDAFRRQKAEVEALRAELTKWRSYSSLSTKLWLEDMADADEPIEFTVFGTARDIGRLGVRLDKLFKDEAELAKIERAPTIATPQSTN